MKNIKLSILDLARFTKSEKTAHDVLKHAA